MDKMTTLVCDFCTKPDPEWRLPATTFVVKMQRGPDWGSLGDWAACTECKDLVVAGDRDALFAATTKMFPRAVRSAVRRDVRAMHDKFFENWSKNVVPNGPVYHEETDGTVRYEPGGSG